MSDPLTPTRLRELALAALEASRLPQSPHPGVLTFKDIEDCERALETFHALEKVLTPAVVVALVDRLERATSHDWGCPDPPMTTPLTPEPSHD